MPWITTPSSSDMDLTAPGSSSIHMWKRPLEAEEEDKVPEEFQPLAISTPNVSSYIVPDIWECTLQQERSLHSVCVGGGGGWRSTRNVVSGITAF